MVGARLFRGKTRSRREDGLKAEIVAVGTELLLGQIPNGNAQEISTALASIGVDVHHHIVVGDNHDRMVAALRSSVERADAVIVTGGLGPTSDDITREAVAEVIGTAIVRDPRLEETVRSIFDRLGREMPEGNLKQADLPEGATSIPPEGTAPGFFIEHEGSVIFCLPGVPWEMRAMLTKTVLPELRKRGGEASIVTREILVMGLGESKTQELIGDIVEEQTNPTIAYLAGKGQVRVRLAAKAGSENDALALIRPIEERIRERLGIDAVEGSFPNMALAFGEFLRERGITVAVAESLTGGEMAAALSGCGGSSDFFKGGLVTYATESKRDVAGVDEATLLGPGAVSEETAGQMAEAAASRFKADLGLAATGVAGPSEQEGKPVGLVYLGASFGGKTEVRRIQAYGDRENIRGASVAAAFDLGRRLVLSLE